MVRFDLSSFLSFFAETSGLLTEGRIAGVGTTADTAAPTLPEDEAVLAGRGGGKAAVEGVAAEGAAVGESRAELMTPIGAGARDARREPVGSCELEASMVRVAEMD